MRAGTPPKQLRIADRTDGLNPERVRSCNERVVLSLLLQNEGISRLEIGSRTKLSQQSVSVIVRSLEQEGLVSRGEAMRGRVGPPTIPVLLNPNGAYSVGIDLGNLETEVVLIDFMGGVRFHKKLALHNPGEVGSHSEIKECVAQAISVLPEEMRSRVTGIGLALPEDGRSLSAMHLPTLEELNLQKELELNFKLPVFVQNDITAAAGAEMMFGATKTASDHLYFFLGSIFTAGWCSTIMFTQATTPLHLTVLTLVFSISKRSFRVMDPHYRILNLKIGTCWVMRWDVGGASVSAH